MSSNLSIGYAIQWKECIFSQKNYLINICIWFISFQESLNIIKELKFKIAFSTTFFIHFFTFSYPCNGRESIVLSSNFRNGDFLFNYALWGSLNTKMIFLEFGLCVCYQNNSKINCSRNIKFNILKILSYIGATFFYINF